MIFTKNPRENLTFVIKVDNRQKIISFSCRLQDMNNLAEMKNDGQIISLSVGKIQHQYFMSC